MIVELFLQCINFNFHVIGIMYPSFVSFDVSTCFNSQMYLSFEPTLGNEHLT